MKQNKKNIKLAKFLAYVLGRRPDEFGLVPDKNGFIKFKDLLKAFHEEEGWKHIRKSHINEVRMTLPNPGIEIQDNLIRATDRENLPEQRPAQNMPKLLYTCVRSKAYPFVSENGISPMGHDHVILSSEMEMAKRIGKRYDAEPILLTVNVDKAVQKGTLIQEQGKMIHLARSIPVGCFTGPPLPKEKPETKAAGTQKTIQEQMSPGSLFPDLKKEKARKGKSKDKGWKKDRKKLRKQKEKMWSDY